MSQMRRWSRHLDWRLIASAVLEVYYENQHNAQEFGVPGDSDQWVMYSSLRESLMRRVRDRWCVLSGKQESWFPYNEDGVIRIYMRYRKRSEAELAAFTDEMSRV